MATWKETVVGSIGGQVGDLIRAKTGVASTVAGIDRDFVANQLRVNPNWLNSQYQKYVDTFGADTNRILYSAMQEQRLEGTHDKIKQHFATPKACGDAVKTFIKMCNNLVEPVQAGEDVEEADDEPVLSGTSQVLDPIDPAIFTSVVVLPEMQDTAGKTIESPVDNFISALAMSSRTNKKLISVYMLMRVMPNTAVKARSYLEGKLNIRPVHEPLIQAWLAANTPISASTLEEVGQQAGGFDDLPASLHAWYKLDVPFRHSLAAAMTQPNALSLIETYLPAPGLLGRRLIVDSVKDIRSRFPSLDAWFAGKTAAAALVAK